MLTPFRFEFKCDTKTIRKYFLSMPRFELGSLGWMMNALVNSATPPLLVVFVFFNRIKGTTKKLDFHWFFESIEWEVNSVYVILLLLKLSQPISSWYYCVIKKFFISLLCSLLNSLLCSLLNSLLRLKL
jgi:hypothetical protein